MVCNMQAMVFRPWTATTAICYLLPWGGCMFISFFYFKYVTAVFFLPSLSSALLIDWYQIYKNSLGPCETMRWRVSGSTPAQVLDCCLTAASNSLNQCWLTISRVLHHLPKGGSNGNVQENPVPGTNELSSFLRMLDIKHATVNNSWMKQGFVCTTVFAGYIIILILTPLCQRCHILLKWRGRCCEVANIWMKTHICPFPLRVFGPVSYDLNHGTIKHWIQETEKYWIHI